MHPTVRDALQRREYARRSRDTALERACNADLARFGYDDQSALGHVRQQETTVATVPEQEQAVPPAPKRGRRPLPRCEHGQIADRCIECNQED